MAYVKGHGLRGNVQRAIDYIVNEAKTRNGSLVSWSSMSGSTPSTMGIQWDIRKAIVEQKDYRKKSDIVGYHFEQSFAPGEIDEISAHRIGQEFAERLTCGEFDYVIATHIDRGHIHNHIIVNPINNINDRLWNIYWKKDLKKFREISDTLCRENGLSVIENPSLQDKTYYEWMISQKGHTEKEIVMKTIDELVEKVLDYSQFKTCLQNLGYSVEDDLTEMQVDKFQFTANKKLFQKETDEFFFFRIPYKKGMMQIPKSQVEWLDGNKTAKVSLNDSTYALYDKEGLYLKEVEIHEIKQDWEDKGKKQRKGLRIKPPGYDKFVRCERLHVQGKGYSLDDVINRISLNDIIVVDDEILEILSGNDPNAKDKFYDRINIKERWKESGIYKSARQERYYQWKTKTVMTRYNAIAYQRYIEEEKLNLEDYRKDRKELINELNDCSTDLKKAENTYRMIQEKSLLGQLEITDEELEKFVQDTIAPLQKVRLNLKSEIHSIDKRIKDIEDREKRKNITSTKEAL